MPLYHVYTDGACSGNPGPGGWGVVILDSTENLTREISGFQPNTTNNRMELFAAISGIKQVLDWTSSPQVLLYSDSSYLINAFNQGWVKSWLKSDWKKGTVKNRDLWQELVNLAVRTEIKWMKVKGHADNRYNNRCDQLAVSEIKRQTPDAAGSKDRTPKSVSNQVTEASSDGNRQVVTKGSGTARLTPGQVRRPGVDPVLLNNPHGKKPSENRCLVSIADLPLNTAKIRHIAERYTYADMKAKFNRDTITSINNSVAFATYNHPSVKIHPFFLQVGQMTDFWLERNAARPNPYPVPERQELVKLICTFIADVGVKKAQEYGLEVDILGQPGQK